MLGVGGKIDSIIVNVGNWIWRGDRTIVLYDKYDNITTNISKEYLEISISNGRAEIFREKVAIEGGKVKINASLFNEVAKTPGDFIITFEYKTLTKLIEYRCTANKESSALNFTIEVKKLESQIQEKQRKIKEIEIERDNQVHFEESTNKLQTKHQQLAKELEVINRDNSMNRYSPVHQEQIQLLQTFEFYRVNRSFVLGNVGCLASVESNELNIALSNWVGKKKLSSIVLDVVDLSNRTRERIMMAHERELDLIKTLKNEIKSHRREIELNIELLNRKVKCEYEQNNPQKLIKFSTIEARGFLGYAVNLLLLNDEQLQRDLRKYLWYPILHSTLVFEKTSDLTSFLQADRSDRSRAIHAFSLDGYQIRGNSISLTNKVKSSVAAFPPVEDKHKRQKIIKDMEFIEITLNHRKELDERLQTLMTELEDIQAQKLELQQQHQAQSQPSISAPLPPWQSSSNSPQTPQRQTTQPQQHISPPQPAPYNNQPNTPQSNYQSTPYNNYANSNQSGNYSYSNNQNNYYDQNSYNRNYNADPSYNQNQNNYDNYNQNYYDSRTNGPVSDTGNFYGSRQSYPDNYSQNRSYDNYNTQPSFNNNYNNTPEPSVPQKRRAAVRSIPPPKKPRQ